MADINSRIANLSPEKRALASLLLKKKAARLSASRTIAKREAADSYPLSFAQQRLWFLSNLEPENPFYNGQQAVRLTGPLDCLALEQSLNEVVRRHESLRTVFVSNGGEPRQIIEPARPLRLPIIDLREIPEGMREAEALRVAQESARRAFDLSSGPLLDFMMVRLDDEDHIVQMTAHHITADGWSLGILAREVGVLYEAFSKGEPSPLPDLAVQYPDFAVWQREWLQGEVLEQHLSYWKQKLDGLSVLELPTDHPRPPHRSYRGARHPVNIEGPVYGGLKALAQQEDVTLFMCLLAAYQVFLYRYTGQEDIVVGAPVASRNRVELEPLIGFFTNMFVLRTDCGGRPNFRQLLERVRETVLGAYAHQDLPFEIIVDELQPERSLTQTPLFQVTFTFQSAGMAAPEFSSLALNPVAIDAGTSKFDLSLTLIDTGQSLLGSLQYNTDIFLTETAARIESHFKRLLEQIVENPDASISTPSLLTEGERRQILEEWSGAHTCAPQEATIQELFERQAELAPDAIALMFADIELSYGELNRRSNQLAHHLIALGVGPEVPVALCMERSLEMVVGLLGILKAGGFYVPLDPAYPLERLSFILDDVLAPVLLTQDNCLDRLPSHWGHLVCIDSDWEEIAQHGMENPPVRVKGDNLAYVNYTSGTTGLPKGSAIPHRAIPGFIAWTDDLKLDQSQTFIQYSSVSWDALTLELWPALISGARCAIYSESVMTPENLGQAIRRHDVTILWVTSSLLNSIIDSKPDALFGIKQLLTGGEALSVTHIRRIQELMPEIDIINGYGPSECTVFCCSHKIARGIRKGEERIPIGRPIGDRSVYLLDKEMNLVPVGVAGELCIGGPAVARGYLNRQELTSEKFIPNPFASREGERLYRTGDLVRYLPDGKMEFLGRKDNQVKIRGFRIELEEIESVLSNHIAVKLCVVKPLAREAEAEIYLAAYVVCKPERETSAEELTGYLRQRLPAYMVPSWVMIIEEMPLTATGKVDRRRLPAPHEIGSYASRAVEPPRTETEAVLAEIWGQVLKRENIGVNDNFFDLGGDSILSIQITARANQAGLRLTTQQIFLHQTIAELAAVTGTVEAVSAEQSPVTGEIPLTPVQRWFFDTHKNEPYHYNQSALTEVREGLDVACLKEALGHCLAHHDGLRLRFVQGEKGWQQFNAPPGQDVPLASVDLSAVPDEHQSRFIEAVAAQAQASLDLSSGVLMQVVFIELGRGKSNRLLIVIHHLAVDIVSWKVLLEDIQKAYEQLSQGGTVEFPEKTTSFKEWSERLIEYAASEELKDEMDYWLAGPREESAHLPVDFNDTTNTEECSSTIFIEMAEDETRSLLTGVPSAYRTQINDLLLTALVQSFADWTGRRSLLINLEGHGRVEIASGIDLTRTVGWFTTYAPVLLELKGDTVGSALKGVKEQLRAVPNHGIGYGVLRYMTADPEITRRLESLPWPEVIFNYIGQSRASRDGSLPLQPANESKGPNRSPRAIRAHPLEINGQVLGGRLILAWTFSEKIHRRETIEALAQSYSDALRALIVHCLSADAGGYTPSDFPMSGLNQQELDTLFGNDRQIEDIYPLSPLQEGMLFHAMYEPESGAYLAQTSCRLQGHLDVPAFERAWQQVIDWHAILRTSFVWEGLEEPVEVVHRNVRAPITKLDWLGHPSGEASARLEAFLGDERRRGLDIGTAPLMRITLIRTSEDCHDLVLTFHHIVCDGWSWAIILNQVFACYDAFRSNEKIDRKPQTPYRDYIAWLRRQDRQSAEQFWREELKGVTAPTPLGLDTPGRSLSAQESAYDMKEIRLSSETAATLQQIVRQHKLTSNTLMQGVWAILLSKYSGESDVVYGMTISGRPAQLPGAETMVGLFINTLPARMQVSPEAALIPWLKQLQDRQVEVREYEHCSLTDIQGWSEVPRGLPLFESLFVFEQYPAPASTAIVDTQARAVESLSIGEARMKEPTHYPLTVEVAPGAEIVIRLGFDRRHFSDSVIERMLGHFQTLIEEIARDPDGSLSDFEILPAEERNRLLIEWNRTETEYPRHQSVHQLFEAQVRQTPEAIAAICGEEEVTYAELNRRANRIAHLLVECQVGPDSVTGLFAARGIDFLTSILAIFKAGGAYLPLDPNYPPGRLAQVIEQSRIRLLITSEDLSPVIVDALESMEEGSRPAILRIEELFGSAASDENLPRRSGPDNLAYVIYTSGSTGIPKGAMVEHAGMLNHLYAKIHTLSLSPQDKVAQTASQSFDISVWQFLAALLTGGQVHIFRDEIAFDVEHLLQEVSLERVTILETVPSLLSVALEEASTVGSARLDLSSLRWLIPTGEALPPELCRRWLKLYPEIPLLNAYGPTECSDDVTHYPIHEAPGPDVLIMPIGRPVANTRIYILDDRMNPVPEGVRGELCVAGVGVGRGYLYDEKRTAEAFIRDPLSDDPSERLYRTGDLARFLPDGNMEFLGRKDHQVKIRGFRIEIGEIEAVLREHSDVLNTVVIVREDTPGNKRLIAYVVPVEENEPDTEKLRGFLKERLPEYMVPSTFVFIGSLPLTANGKVDRRALPVPESSDPSRPDSFIAPETATEELVAGIWAKALGVQRVGRKDNFFDLGGHSLLVTKVISQMRKASGLQLPLRVLFDAPALDELAKAVDDIKAGKDAGEPALREIDLAAEASLDLSIEPASPYIATGEPCDVFMTGATGFLGAFLLRELLVQTHSQVYCLVRSRSLEEGRLKIRHNLENYLLWDEGLDTNIVPVPGDLSRPLFGMSEKEFEHLAGKVEIVYHSAAHLNAVLPYRALKATNVSGTQEVLRLACLLRPKPVHYVSTIDVLRAAELLPGSAPDQRIRVEQDDLREWKRLTEGYAQTKWVAERLVIEAKSRGLPVCIYRPVTISGQSETGMWNRDDTLCRMIKGCIELGSAPDADVKMDMVPVDYVGKAIVHLSRQREAYGKVFHLVNPTVPSAAQIAERMRSYGYEVKPLPFEDWLKEIVEVCADRPDHALYPLLPVFSEMHERITAARQYSTAPREAVTGGIVIQTDWRNTREGLAGSGIECPPADDALLDRYFNYLIGSGFLNPPPSPAD